MSETLSYQPNPSGQQENKTGGMRSKVDEIFDRLEAEGKVIPLTAEELVSINTEISGKMEDLKWELLKREQALYPNDVLLPRSAPLDNV